MYIINLLWVCGLFLGLILYLGTGAMLGSVLTVVIGIMSEDDEEEDNTAWLDSWWFVVFWPIGLGLLLVMMGWGAFVAGVNELYATVTFWKKT